MGLCEQGRNLFRSGACAVANCFILVEISHEY